MGWRTPLPKFVLHPRTKMLVQCPLDGDKLQALLGKEHPECNIFGYWTCPVCGRHMHGHGWRSRVVQDSASTSFRIWIHRKLCPNCGLTCTLLPKTLHALKFYTLDLIIKVLTSIGKLGHCDSRIEVPLKMQRIWYGQYRKRLRIFTEFSSPGQQDYGVVPCAPITLTEMRDSANLLTWAGQCCKSHHRLGFFFQKGAT